MVERSNAQYLLHQRTKRSRVQILALCKDFLAKNLDLYLRQLLGQRVTRPLDFNFNFESGKSGKNLVHLFLLLYNVKKYIMITEVE